MLRKISFLLLCLSCIITSYARSHECLKTPVANLGTCSEVCYKKNKGHATLVNCGDRAYSLCQGYCRCVCQK